jgi:hypothetical protein
LCFQPEHELVELPAIAELTTDHASSDCELFGGQDVT